MYNSKERLEQIEQELQLVVDFSHKYTESFSLELFLTNLFIFSRIEK